MALVVTCMQVAPQKCVSNLHYLVCRAHCQEQARGRVQNDLEIWVEREVRATKGATSNVATVSAEKCMANSALEEERLATLEGQWRDLKRADALVPEYRAAAMDYSRDPLFDDQ